MASAYPTPRGPRVPPEMVWPLTGIAVVVLAALLWGVALFDGAEDRSAATIPHRVEALSSPAEAEAEAVRRAFCLRIGCDGTTRNARRGTADPPPR